MTLIVLNKPSQLNGLITGEMTGTKKRNREMENLRPGADLRYDGSTGRPRGGRNLEGIKSG